MTEKLLLLRGGLHKEFAYKTLFKKNVELIIMDTMSNSQYPFADYQYLIDNNIDTDILFEAALDIYSDIGFNGIGTFMNSPVPALGRLSDYFELHYLTEKSGIILNSKAKTREFLKAKKLDSTLYYDIHSISELEQVSKILKYPFVLKPTDTASGVGVKVLNCHEELIEAYNDAIKYSNNKLLIAEEYISGAEYCAEIIIINGEVFVLAISEKILSDDDRCIELMDITPARIDEKTRVAINDYFVEVFSVFEIENLLVHVEFKLKDRQSVPRIIEINPRGAGGNLLESVYHLKGLNPYDLVFDIMLKRKINIEMLKKSLVNKYQGYSLFYTFLTPLESGTVKSVSGEKEIMKDLHGKGERIDLYCKVGQKLSKPMNNLDFRGSIYLLGGDINELISRAKSIENKIAIKI